MCGGFVMPTEQRVYWDSDVIISLLSKDAERIGILAQLIGRAESDEIRIVASTFSLCEVVRVDERLPDQERLIVEFFRSPYILIQPLDWSVAQKTRAIVRRLGIKPNDAVHIASAIQADASVMHTYDEKLLKLSGKVGDPPLRIEEPKWKNDQPPLDGTLS
jgi:predicted nucleic acid-binding protein